MRICSADCRLLLVRESLSVQECLVRHLTIMVENLAAVGVNVGLIVDTVAVAAVVGDVADSAVVASLGVVASLIDFGAETAVVVADAAVIAVEVVVVVVVAGAVVVAVVVKRLSSAV